MKPGDLARIFVPLPSLFESIGSEPVRLMREGEFVILLEHEPERWPRPRWRVLYEDQVGIIDEKWLRRVEEPGQRNITDDD